MQADSSSIIDGSESEDDFDWEEVVVPDAAGPPAEEEENIISILPTEPVPSGSSTPAANIEITLKARPRPDEEAKYVRRCARSAWLTTGAGSGRRRCTRSASRG